MLEPGDLANVVVHQRHVRSFNRAVGTFDPHGKSDAGPGKCRCIIDAVAHHRRRRLIFQGIHRRQFLFRQEFGFDVGVRKPHAVPDRFRRPAVVPRQQPRRQPRLFHRGNGFDRAVLQRIGHRKNTDHAEHVTHRHRRFTGGVRFFKCGFHGRHREFLLTQPPQIGEPNEGTVHPAFRAVPRERLKVFHDRRFRPTGFGRTRNCAAHRVRTHRRQTRRQLPHRLFVRRPRQRN